MIFSSVIAASVHEYNEYHEYKFAILHFMLLISWFLKFA